MVFISERFGHKLNGDNMLRFKDFLTEASLGGTHRTGKSALDYYVPDHAVNSVEYNMENEDSLLDSLESKKVLGILTKKDVITIVSKDVSKQGIYKYIKVSSKRFGAGYVKLSSIQRPSSDRSFNRGDIAEGIVGVAIAVKFANPNRKITIDDVYSTIDKLDDTGELQLHNQENDTIKLVVKLSPVNYANFINHSYRKDLLDEFTSAIKFANSTRIESAKEINKNHTDDTVISASDGISNQKGTKIDTTVSIGLDGHTPVKYLSMSLKTGTTKTLGQYGTKLPRFIEFWGWFGITIKPDKYELKQEWFKDLFMEVKSDINHKLGSDNKEKTFLSTLAKGLKLVATGGDDSVVMLHLKNGDFNLHSFTNIDAKLKDIKLKAIYHEAKRPEIRIIDTVTNEVLVGFRLEVRGSDKESFKIFVQKGPLLDKLTQVK